MFGVDWLVDVGKLLSVRPGVDGIDIEGLGFGSGIAGSGSLKSESERCDLSAG